MAIKRLSAATLALLMTLVIASPARAAIIVGQLEWFQPKDLTNYSWNEINAVCSGGSCSGVIGGSGPDLSGWQWASAQELGDLLLAQTSSHPGGIATWNGSYAQGQDFFALGFTPTTSLLQLVDFGIQGVLGFTSTLAGVDNPYWGGAGTNLGFPGFDPSSDFFSDQTGLAANTRQDTVGAWLYRTAPIPVTGSAALFMLGLVTLAFRRQQTR